jgi:hypothetical protein
VLVPLLFSNTADAVLYVSHGLGCGAVGVEAVSLSQLILISENSAVIRMKMVIFDFIIFRKFV